jgi:hypothetical protein
VRLRLHPLRDPTGLSILVAVAIGVSGCGATAVVRTDTSAHARVAKPTSAYRVGQYCVSSTEAKYRAAGLTCAQHHLARH